jgi:hypothetical protein
MRSHRYVPCLALLLALAACSGETRPPNVEASGKGAVAAGRDVVIDKNTVINEYNEEKARRIEASRFARAVSRECQQYLPIARAFQLKREKDDRSDAIMPPFFGPLYGSPDVQRIFGESIYRELNSQSQHLSSLRSAVFDMRNRYMMSSAFQMMGQYSRRAKERAQQMPAAPSEEEFAAAKNRLVEKTEAHCKYLESLA